MGVFLMMVVVTKEYIRYYSRIENSIGKLRENYVYGHTITAFSQYYMRIYRPKAHF